MTAADPPPGTTVAKLGEFGLIALLGPRFEQGDHVLLGPGDDAALLRTPQGHVVVSTDLQVEGRHFRRDWASALDIGHKAAAQALSDVTAMGGRTHSVTVGLATPGDLEAQWALDLADGIAAECAGVGASVVGGDLTRAEEVMVSLTVIGACERSPVLRSGARPGQLVCLAGRQGWAAAGLAVLARGFRSPRALVEAYQRPTPPYDAGPQAARAGATAMIDVSDGLVADLGHLATGSGVRIDLQTSAFELAEPFHAVAAALGVDPMDFVLGGGDDHALAATFDSLAAVPDGWRVVGSVLEAPAGGPGSGPGGGPGSGSGVTVDGTAYAGRPGWDHFA